MSWWSDIGDNLSSAWDNIKSGDILGAAEDLLNFGFDAITLGTFSYMKDQARGLFEYPDIPFQDRKQIVRTSTGPRQVVYGHTRVGGHLVFSESFGPDKRFYMMTLVVAAHSVEKILAVYANGVKVASARASGNGLMPVVYDGRFNVGEGATHIYCWSADGRFYPAIIPTFPEIGSAPGWTNAHQLRGQAYVHIVLQYSEDPFETGLPRFEVELLGKDDILDPRTNTSGYTDNQALAALDILRWSRMFNLPFNKLFLDTFAAGADIADELVTAGPGKTEKRYTVNGAYLMQAPPLDILESIAAAGASYVQRFQGRWAYVPGAYTAPEMDLDESDLVGGLKFQPGPGKSARHNMARGTYVDAAQDFEAVEFRSLRIGAYINDDLEELERNFEFPWTNSGTMARRLAKIEIERGRYGLSVSARFKFRTLRLTPGDRVTLSIAQLGWENKVFRVEDTEADYNAGVRLELREDSPEVYAWEEGDALALDPPPPINLPNGLEISPPKNITITEELYQTLTRAAIKVRLNVAWDADDVAKAYDIQYKLQSETRWTPAGTFWQDNDISIDDVLDEPYDLRFRAINTIGRRSAWLTIPYSVKGKSAPPPDVGIVLVDRGSLRWSYPDAPLDLAGYKIRFQNGDRKLWVDASPAHEGLVTETVFDVSRYSGTKTFLVKAVDTTGNESLNASVVVQGLNDPEILNVLLSESQAAANWPGTVTGGFVNASNELEASQLGVFWGEPNAPFWPLDPSAPFWGDEYQALVYEFTMDVAAINAGSNLTVGVVLDGAANTRIDYKPPGYAGGFVAFPGSIRSEEGTYTFRFTIPTQVSGTAPTVEDISVSLDVDDIEESFSDVAVPIGGIRLPITKTYRAIKNISLTRKADGGTAAQAVYLDKDEDLGPLIETRDTSGNSVAGVVDATIKGY